MTRRKARPHSRVSGRYPNPPKLEEALVPASPGHNQGRRRRSADPRPRGLQYNLPERLARDAHNLASRLSAARSRLAGQLLKHCSGRSLLGSVPPGLVSSNPRLLVWHLKPLWAPTPTRQSTRQVDMHGNLQPWDPRFSVAILANGSAVQLKYLI